jgi:hypothetical protein
MRARELLGLVEDGAHPGIAGFAQALLGPEVVDHQGGRYPRLGGDRAHRRPGESLGGELAHRDLPDPRIRRKVPSLNSAGSN